MILYSVTLKSTSAMMFNKMSDAALEGLLHPGSKKKKTIEERPLRDIAKECLHLDGDENPLIPLSGVMQAFAKAAGSFSKAKGRGSMKSVAAGAFRIQHEYSEILHSETGKNHHDWIVDFRRGNNANVGKGCAIPLVRPKFESWKASFDVAIDTEILSEATAVEILNYAGRVVGLGAWRFENLGPCGGFFVQEIKKIE